MPYCFSSTALTNSIIHDHSCKILCFLDMLRRIHIKVCTNDVPGKVISYIYMHCFHSSGDRNGAVHWNGLKGLHWTWGRNCDCEGQKL